ncbi:baseplate J/gp47 family protein [Paenibacillus taichungensis]|nr:baseplate J/gp47 family protein [Paenibacillus taichungensis]MEC0194790.1 baseplate J/gp47 family protein [Paenibacillus taichungensis]
MADLEQVLKTLLDGIGDEYDKTAGYMTYDMLKSVSLVAVQLFDRIEDISALIDVENLSGDMLAAFVLQRKGITRTAATNAKGTLLVTGNGTINIGDLFETPSGVQFQAVETKNIAGSAYVSISAVMSGVIGNVPANQVVQMPVTLSGITAVTNPEPTHDGYAAETDTSLRERYYIAVRTPPTSGNVYHYLSWAKTISGVGDAKVFPAARGENTVEVVIIDQFKSPASLELVSEVQAYIDPDSTGLGMGEAPIGAKCYVLSATGLPLNISVSVQMAPDITEPELQANIEASITSYLQSIAFDQDYVSYARIGQAVLDSAGVVDYSGLSLNGGIDNIPVGLKEVAILGAVSFD